MRPKAVQIGAHKYDILWSLDSWKKYAKDQLKDKIGLCLSDKGIILVNGWDLSKSQQQDTLLHEILHGCFSVIGFQHHDSKMPKNKHDLEELVVLILAPLLHLVFRDNPELVEWLSNE